MIVKCITNDARNLNKRLAKLAFTQDEQGMLDLTQSRSYKVYGVRKNKFGQFYLILTDSVHLQTPWWMPAALFEIESGNTPKSWVKHSYGFLSRSWTLAHPSYFDAELEIEDGTTEGILIFDRIKANVDSSSD